MRFLRVVEVFPPSIQEPSPRRASFRGTVSKFLRDVDRIADFADLILVARVTGPQTTYLPTIAVASMLEERSKVNAAPVIVARDFSRSEISSAILGSLAGGIRSLMLAWGDKGRPEGPKGGHDFGSLSEVIQRAREISESMGVNCVLLAPVDLTLISTKGPRLAKSRLDSGADLLLAQPPTTDAERDFERHLDILDSVGLRDKVLLGVFPFRDREDVADMERRFGWKLPSSLRRRASSAGFDPIAESRALVHRMREEGLAGVYLSTRGHIGVAEQVLGDGRP